MSKSHYLENIFADLKDEIAFDEDVVALYKLLKVMLKYDVKQSVNNWLYLMKNYNLKTLRQEIDFTPLTKEFIIELLRYQDLTQLFLNFKRIPNDNLNHILKEFMNVFNKESGIYQYFYGLIKEHKNELELSEIYFVVKVSSKFDILVFDLTSFLKEIIKIHISLHDINKTLFEQLVCIPKSQKEQALLRTIFIDYI